MKKGFIYIAVALALLVGMILPSIALAADHPDSTNTGGSFTAKNKPPTITSVALDDMSPTVETAVTMTIGDPNKLKDLSKVEVTIFYCADGPDYPVNSLLTVDTLAIDTTITVANGALFAEDESIIISDKTHSATKTIAHGGVTGDVLTLTGAVGSVFTMATGGAVTAMRDVPLTGDTHEVAILTCTVTESGNGPGGLGNWTMVPNTSTVPDTTWSIVPADCIQGTLTSSSSGFTFAFVPGKVALETDTSNHWCVYARATDKTNGIGDAEDATPNAMYFYGEIADLTGSVTFTDVDPGAAAFKINDAAVSTTYIANGTYLIKIMTNDGGTPVHPYWKSGSDTVNLVTSAYTTGVPADGSFVLLADDDATLNYSADTIQVTDDYDGTQATSGDTDETPTANPDNNFWIRLGANDIPVGTYAGTIYIQVSNS